MSTALQTIGGKLAERFNMGANATEVLEILKATAFKSKNGVSDAQMTALMVVADQYGLNPFTKEIFAYPDRDSIVPVVSVDGWSRIINEHPQFDGLEFEHDADSCTCVIYRKDRGHSIKITEYLSECKKQNSNAWASHPKRMLRHKSLIQCARLAFGFVGIYDQDEAERIAEIDVTQPSSTIKQPQSKSTPQTTDTSVSTIDSETGEIVTDNPANSLLAEQGEVNFLLSKFKALKNVTQEDVMSEAEISSMDGLTKDGFNALRKALKGKS